MSSEQRNGALRAPVRSDARRKETNRAEGDDQSLDIVQIVSRRRKAILGGCIVGWLLAGAYYLLAPPVFQSASQLLVMQKDPTLAARGVGGAEDAQASVSDDLLATQMQLLQSRRIVSEALKAHKLDGLESIVSKLDDDESPEEYVIDHLSVTRGGAGQASTARVLNVAFRHSSADEAKLILDALIERYQDFATETFQDVNKEAADLIDQARTDLSTELSAAEEAYRKYREEAPLLWSGDISSNVHRTRYEGLEAELSQLSLDISETAARLEIVQGVVQQQDRDGASGMERLVVIDEKNAQRVGMLVTAQQGEALSAQFLAAQPQRLENARGEYESLMQLRMRERELLEEFGPQHPTVVNVRNQIGAATEFLGKKAGSFGLAGGETSVDPKSLQRAYVQLLTRDVEAFQKRRQELESLAAKEETEAKQLVKYELEGESLRQSMGRQQGLYDAVVDRLREINMATNYGGQINEVIAPAESGVEVWPKLPICLALGTVVGLLLGVGAATAAELKDNSFKTPEDIRQALGAPLLSHVPKMHLDANEALAAALKASKSTMAPGLITHHLPRSKEAEVFRGLRTSIFFRAAEDSLRTIAFTSPHKADGKSTVISNLAVSIAQSGRRVLLVEADLRRPSLQASFGLSAEEGLASVIADGAEPWDLCLTTHVENLSVLPCGRTPENPAELLTLPRFKEFLELARERYDYVLIDCPPVLAVADPCIVAGVADAVVLVLRTSRDSRPESQHVREKLDEVGAKLIGAVVNCSDEPGVTRVGGYHYGYASAYMPEAPELQKA